MAFHARCLGAQRIGQLVGGRDAVLVRVGERQAGREGRSLRGDVLPAVDEPTTQEPKAPVAVPAGVAHGLRRRDLAGGIEAGQLGLDALELPARIVERAARPYLLLMRVMERAGEAVDDRVRRDRERLELHVAERPEGQLAQRLRERLAGGRCLRLRGREALAGIAELQRLTDGGGERRGIPRLDRRPRAPSAVRSSTS